MLWRINLFPSHDPGPFNHWDDGTGPHTGNGYTATMWYLIIGGGAPQVNRFDFSDGQTLVPDNPRYGLSLTGVSGSPYISTRIPLLRKLSETTVTIKAYLKADVSIPNTYFEVHQNFGSGGSSATNTISPSFTVTTSWQAFEYQIDIPSIAPKTIGTSPYIRVGIRGGDFTLGTLDVANFSMVEGHKPFNSLWLTAEEERIRINYLWNRFRLSHRAKAVAANDFYGSSVSIPQMRGSAAAALTTDGSSTETNLASKTANVVYDDSSTNVFFEIESTASGDVEASQIICELDNSLVSR